MSDNEHDAKPEPRPDDAHEPRQRKAYRPPELRPLGDLHRVTLKSGANSDNTVHPTRP